MLNHEKTAQSNCGRWVSSAVIALLMMGVATDAAARTNLRFAHWLPAGHPLAQTGFVPWTESITEASGGTLRFSFFPAQQLGASEDHHDMARDGIADITFTNMSYNVGRFPIAGAGEIPFLVSDSVAGSRAYNDWYQAYAASEVRGAKVCMLFLQPAGTIHSSRSAISHPDDVRGKSMRPPNANLGTLFSQLGGSNVQIGAPESREALARGVADALAFPWDSVYTFGVNEVVRYHLDMPLYVNVFGIIMNHRRYDRLTAQQQSAVDSHCTGEWASRIMSEWNESNSEARQRFIDDAQHLVHTPTDEEVAAWVAVARPIRDIWAAAVQRAGHDPEAIWDDLVERLRAAGALYSQ